MISQTSPRNKLPFKLLAGFLLPLLFIGADSVAQEVRYVRDYLYVPVRSGQGNAYRIVHRGLKSGEKVTVLEENAESGYSRISTDDGIEGWIETQYLVEQPTAQLQLNVARETIRKLEAELGPLRKENASLKRSEDKSQQQLDNTNKDVQRLSDELAHIKKISSNAINLDRSNKDYIKKNELLKNELDVLSAENERLKESAEQEGFINGALAVGFGVFLALVIPHLVPRKKRNSEWA